jgi:hypothetical protein
LAASSPQSGGGSFFLKIPAAPGLHAQSNRAATSTRAGFAKEEQFVNMQSP